MNRVVDTACPRARTSTRILASARFVAAAWGCLLAAGCGGATPAPRGSPAKALTPAPPAAAAGFQVCTYSNDSGATLSVSDVQAGRHFAYTFVATQPEDCAGVRYSGRAKVQGPGEAKGGEGDVFRVTAKGLSFEPDISQVGMGCARVLHTTFVCRR